MPPISSTSPSSSDPPLKILCLHGYTQTGPQFSSKTGALRKALISAFAPRTVELVYPTAPIRLRAQDIPGFEPAAGGHEDEDEDREIEAYGWWRRRAPPTEPTAAGAEDDDQDFPFGLDAGLQVVVETITRQGPFDGVLGFSQGACLAGIVAALLNTNVDLDPETSASGDLNGYSPSAAAAAEKAAKFSRLPLLAPFFVSQGVPIQRPLKFAILYSGFVVPDGGCRVFWGDAPIPVRSLHVLGSLDTVVSEERSEMLYEAFEPEGRVRLVHPGGHFVPSGKAWLGAAAGFVRDALKDEHGNAQRL